MPTSTISIQQVFAALPEGYQGTPQEFLEWMSENSTFLAEGEFLTGQIGGVRPATDKGIYINGTTIEVWVGGSDGGYKPLTTVPIGTVLDYPSPNSTPPQNYIWAEGQVLNIVDYQELANAYGRTYVRTTDTLAQFRVPNYNGRVSVGAGTTPGEYDPRADPAIPDGLITPRVVGEYFGAEWPIHKVSTQTSAPVPRYSAQMKGDAATDHVWNKPEYTGVSQPSIAVRKIIRAK